MIEAGTPGQMVLCEDWLEVDGMAEARKRLTLLRSAHHAALTLAAYASDWRDFEAWCSKARRVPMPADPETVALYLSDLAGRFKVSTLERRLAAISSRHHAAGLPGPITPDVRAVIAGARRRTKLRVRRKAALTVDELLAISNQLASEDTMRSVRDRAVVLLGFGGAFRRSDLSGLDLADLDLGRDRVVVNLNRSKTDQEARGRQLVIPRARRAELCPVRALRAWLDVRGTGVGPLFFDMSRCGSGLGNLSSKRMPPERPYYIVREAARRSGLDPSRFGAHSLRAGFCTAAADAGADVFEIMATSGHKSVENVEKYVRRSVIRYPLRKVL